MSRRVHEHNQCVLPLLFLTLVLTYSSRRGMICVWRCSQHPPSTRSIYFNVRLHPSLHSLLTSSSASISSSPGFDANLSLPLKLALQPGVAVYSQAKYSGDASFVQPPSSWLTEQHFAICWLSSTLVQYMGRTIHRVIQDRVIFWDSVPNVSQLTSSASGPSALLDIQSSACSPPCAGDSTAVPAKHAPPDSLVRRVRHVPLTGQSAGGDA